MLTLIHSAVDPTDCPGYIVHVFHNIAIYLLIHAVEMPINQLSALFCHSIISDSLWSKQRGSLGCNKLVRE